MGLSGLAQSRIVHLFIVLFAVIALFYYNGRLTQEKLEDILPCSVRNLLFEDRTQQYNRYLSSEPDPDAPSIDHEGLVALLQSGDIQLVDVREPDELIDFGKIDKSYNIPLSRLTKSLEMNEANFIEQFGREKPMKWDINIVFYGMGPIRSRAAVELAHKYGYLKARHYPGGWEEWAEKTGVPFKKC